MMGRLYGPWEIQHIASEIYSGRDPIGEELKGHVCDSVFVSRRRTILMEKASGHYTLLNFGPLRTSGRRAWLSSATLLKITFMAISIVCNQADDLSARRNVISS